MNQLKAKLLVFFFWGHVIVQSFMNRYKRKHWCEWQDFPHEIVKGPIGIEYELFMRVSFDNQRRMDVYPFIISEHIDDQIGIFTTIYEIHSVYNVLKETHYFIIFAKGL